MRGDDDLREPVLRLRHVELRAILIVEILDVLIGDRDLCHHFAVDHFLDGNLLPDIAPQIVDRVAARFELALKFIFGVGTLEFGKLVLDLAVGGLQSQLFRPLKQNLIVDQFIQNIQLQRKRFVLRRLGSVGIQLRAVVLVYLGARDILAVHHGPHALRWLRWLLAAGRHGQGRGQHECSLPTYPHAISSLQQARLEPAPVSVVRCGKVPARLPL